MAYEAVMETVVEPTAAVAAQSARDGLADAIRSSGVWNKVHTGNRCLQEPR